MCSRADSTTIMFATEPMIVRLPAKVVASASTFHIRSVSVKRATQFPATRTNGMLEKALEPATENHANECEQTAIRFWNRMGGMINRCSPQHFSKAQPQNAKVNRQPDHRRRQERTRKFWKRDAEEMSDDHVLRIAHQRGN